MTAESKLIRLLFLIKTRKYFLQYKGKTIDNKVKTIFFILLNTSILYQSSR